MFGTIRSARTLFLVQQIKRNVLVAQNANAPTPIRDPPHEPPARDPSAKPVTGARSWLGKPVPLAFLRFLMIFFFCVVSPLAWQAHRPPPPPPIPSPVVPQASPLPPPA